MLTPSQQQALDSTRHLSVTANAGSGKTLVLVERYVSLVLSGTARVSEVVAITFTEKAASELKRKIAESIAARLVSAADAPTRTRLEAIRDELPGAVIDTIHSFCARILREYPVEADVDAAFTVLEEIDRNALMEAAVRDTIAEILRRAEHDPQREQMFSVLRALGKKKVLDVVHAMMRKRELVDRWLAAGGLYAQSDDAVLKRWRSALIDVAQREADNPSLARDTEMLVRAARGNDAAAIRRLHDRFTHATSLVDRATAFCDVAGKMLTGRGWLRKKVFHEVSPLLLEAAARVKMSRETLLPLLPVLVGENEDRHRELLKQIRFFLAIYQQVANRYSESKEEGTYLDFDDLQLRTRDLLTHEKVREKLSQRFKFIMVDEYQDTNLLQYEILLPLLSWLKKGNLCIVGDPKQSIYGFRDADVSVFNRTKRDILQESGSGSAVTLGASFRLLRDVAAFINLLFSSVMKNDGDEYEVSYDPLVCARQNDAPGRVEVLIGTTAQNADAEEDEDAADNGLTDARALEEEMIARRISQLVQSRYIVFDRKERPQAVRFRDVAVLLRSRTGLGKLEDAFIRHHIPYLVSGGVGYFQTQAIYDFYHYFCFLLDTNDDVALVGILRSPFFNVSDAELFEWRLKHRSVGLWETMQSADADRERFPSMARAAQHLRKDLELAFRLTVPELIDRIVEETAYAGFIAGTSRAEQMHANVEKLKRVSRQYAGRGFTDLYDFTKRLRRLIEEYQEEGQATVDVDADAVRIMTIHSAKGLEFPVVFLPSLDRQFRFDNECFLDEQLGLGYTPAETSAHVPPVVELLKQKAQRRIVSEEKRVLYVACTRARDLLVLSSSKWEGGSSSSCRTWVLNLLSLDGGTAEAEKRFEVTTECLTLHGTTYESVRVRHTVPVHLIRPDDLDAGGEVSIPPVELDPGTPRIHIEPIATHAGGEIFSATKIRTYMECPAKYYLRYVAGLPASTVRLFREEMQEEEDVEIPRDLRGRAFHFVMQHIESIGDDRTRILTELKKFIARDSYSILSEPSIELEALAAMVQSVVRSDFWREVLRGSDSRTEFTIMTRLDRDILLGALDRVYHDADGIWTVLDFKTDAVTRDMLQEKKAHYDAQVRFYSLLVRKFFGCNEVRACLLFSELVESPVRFTFSAEDLNEFENEVRSVIARIHEGDFARNGKPCGGCPFLPEGCRF